jgi:hypothetical protein
MNREERVQILRNEVDKTRRECAGDPEKMRAAESKYQAALIDAVCGGSRVVRGSDLGLTNGTGSSFYHVSFCCDGVNVTSVLYAGKQQVDGPLIFTRSEAVQIGERVANAGVYEQMPSEIATSAIVAFGKRLKEYGENGC